MKSNPFIQRRTTVKELFSDDPENEELYNKIVELFIAAGYFRARLSNLEPFDKILGGLAWTLTGCFYDIDIEFKDDMNLTEKIRVSEKITNGLKKINCPFLLNPVQIQGLDLKPIYQMLQWLVKRLLETRDERNDLNRKFSINYLSSKLPISSSKNSSQKNSILEANENCKENAKYNFGNINRKFRPKTKLSFEYNDELRIFFTMIEFGMNREIAFQKQLIELLKGKNMVSNKDGPSDQNKKQSSMHSNSDPNKLTKEELKTLNDLITTNIEEISEAESKQQKVNKSIFEAIGNDNITEITNQIEQYENTKSDEGIDKLKLFVKEKERLENVKQNLLSQINEYQEELKKAQKDVKEENNQMNTLKSEISQGESTQTQNEANKQKIMQKVKEEKLSEEKLQFLSKKNKEKEELKEAINNFKRNCIEEKKLYDAQGANAESKIEKMNDEENLLVLNEIDNNYNNELQRNIETKKDGFEQNKMINRLTRKIQGYPSKLEVIQYEKRFQELYSQINNVSEKNKALINESNSKEEVSRLLEQRGEVFVDLKNLYKTLKNKRTKEDFKVTLNNVFNGGLEPIQRSTEKLRQTSESIDESQQKNKDLQLYEASYMKLIKEYNKEYNRFNAYNN